MQGVAAELFSVRHEVQLEVWWKACQVTAAPRTTFIFMFGACLGPSLRLSILVRLSKHEEFEERKREIERERNTAQEKETKTSSNLLVIY